MAWKIALVGFLVAAFVMALGPAALFLVGGTIAIILLGLVLTLSVLSIFSPRAYTGDGRGEGDPGARFRENGAAAPLAGGSVDSHRK